MLHRHAARSTPRAPPAGCQGWQCPRTRCWAVKQQAAPAPCIVLTSPDGIGNPSLQVIAEEVRRTLRIECLVIAPSTTPTSSTTATPACDPLNTCSDTFTFESSLQLHHHAEHQHTFSLAGATAADCVLCAVDQTSGLVNCLGLTPVLVLVGVTRSPALSSDMEQHPAVAVARQAALLGLPAVATCLATTSPAAPLQPAAAATLHLLGPLLQLLQSAPGWPSASNYPRAHFPFPEVGRWALGSQLPLPDNHAAGGSGASSWESYMSAASDCWALGNDNSWLGNYNQTSNRSGSGDMRRQSGTESTAAAQRQLRQLLRAAWGDGDTFLCLNVPPTWQPSSGFAAARPGVLWHCWQVAAEHPHQQQPRAAAASVRSSEDRQYSTEDRRYSYGDGQYSTDSSSRTSSWNSGSSSSSRWHSRSSGNTSTSSGSSWGRSDAESGAASDSAGDRWHFVNSSSWRSSSSSSGSRQNGDPSDISTHSTASNTINGSSSGTNSRSWQVDGSDLYGRTLPSTSYSNSNTAPVGSNFVGQDHSRKVAAESRHPISSPTSSRSSWSSNNEEVTGQQAELGVELPTSFTVMRGTMLLDAAACGDVEAVFGGKAAVTLCQTWPAGHPLSCRDALLLAALDEGQGGLPAWLSE